MSEERIRHSAGYALIARLISAALTAGLTIFLGRSLSEGDYGSLTFGLSVIAIASLLAQFSIAASADRFIAERRHRPGAVANVLGVALRVQVVFAGLTSVALLGLAGPLCDLFHAPEAVWPLRVLAIALFCESVYQLFVGAFISSGRVRYNVVLASVESVVEIGVSIALVVAGFGAVGAACGVAGGYAAGALVALPIATRRLGRLRRKMAAEREVAPGEIVRYAGPLLFVDVAFRVFSNVDVMLIALLVGGESAIAAFGIPMRLAVFLDYPAAALASGVTPRLARSGDHEGDVRSLASSIRFLLVFQMLMTAPLVIWPQAIIHLLFGAKYPEAAAVLRALAPYVYLAGIAQVVTLAVNYLGEARRRIPLAVGMLLLNVVLDVVLLPRIGIVGAAIGTSAAYAVWVPGHLIILRRQAALKLKPIVLTALRTTLAGAAVVGLLALMGTGVVSVGVMIAAVVIAPCVYAIVLAATGELRREDLVRLRAAVARPSSAS